MTNENESFFQEVEERLRQEKLEKGLKRYGPWAGGLFAAVLLGAGGWQAYDYFQTESARKHGADYAQAQQLIAEGDLPAALAQFERLSQTGPASYRAMALMERGAILQYQGDLEAATAAFDSAAEIAKDPAMAESARLRAAYLVADTQDFTALRARLEPLIAANGPVSYAARELLGVEAWEAGELDLARSTLENLTLAFDAPESVRQRAQLALAVIGPAPESEAPAEPASEAAPAGESE